MQARTSGFHAVPEIDFDNDAATSSGYDAFADLVQMAVREDPSLASGASTSGIHLTEKRENAANCCIKVACVPA